MPTWSGIVQIPGVMSGTMTHAITFTVQQETEKPLASFRLLIGLSILTCNRTMRTMITSMGRCNAHTIAYMVMLMPLKQCLTRDVHQDSSSSEKILQPTAIDIALKLVRGARQLRDSMLPLHANLYSAPSTIFNTAVSPCSAIIRDQGRCLMQRDEAIEAISATLGTLEQISHSTKTAATCYLVLSKLVNKLSLASEEEFIPRSESSDSPLRGRGVKAPCDSQLTLDAVPTIDFGIIASAARRWTQF
ncbi:hypothetical protein V8F44DRAFT_592223 [Aspergillus fumigatus]